MDKIILRDKKTGTTREVDAKKYAELSPEAKAEIAAVADVISVAPGPGDGLVAEPSFLESMGRGMSMGAYDPGEASSASGMAAEALGSGLRDAGLAFALSRLGAGRLATAVPTITGAVEGAITAPGGPGPKAVGALLGGAMANLPMPKSVEKAVKKVGAAIGEQITAPARRKAAVAAKKAEGIVAKEAELAKKPDYDPGVDLADEIEAQAAMNIELVETAKNLQQAEKRAAARVEKGEKIATVGAESAQADLLRQIPQRIISAIQEDPEYADRDITTLSAGELLRALSRAAARKLQSDEK